MEGASIYTRYSIEEQRPTSIDDQVRRCRETAAKLGISVADNKVFSDSAVSGTAKGRVKRIEYQRLMDAVEYGQVHTIFIDDVSRISRDMLEGAKLMALVESIGLRIVTSDGIDTRSQNWKMLWAFKLFGAVQQVENTAAQVTRGMLGQLIRGYQIAQPPFGYTRYREVDDSGRELGTYWRIDENQAALIRDMYVRRQSGESLARIAKRLNDAGILPPAHRRCSRSPYWRPGSVFRLISNTIYKGEFVWNGSLAARSIARKKRKKLEPISFDRPELQIVSPELWTACNNSVPREVIRGGGRHALSGVMTCGQCGALLTLHVIKNSGSACCPQCEQARRSGGPQRFIGYTSIPAANYALNWCLEQVFDGEVLAEFHKRLQARLIEKPAAEVLRLKKRLQELDMTIQRMKRLALDPEIGEDVFRNELAQATSEQKLKTAQLDTLMHRTAQVTEAAVQMQSSIDPLKLIKRLLEGEPEVYKVRATLKRLVKKFVFVARPRKYVSVFEISFCQGVGVAQVSNSEVLDDLLVTYRVTVTTSSVRPTQWRVEGERI